MANEDHDEFYRLIPTNHRDAREENSELLSEDTLYNLLHDLLGKQFEKVLQAIAQRRADEQKRLLSLYGYAAERINETESALYWKASFIRKTLPMDTRREEALLILLSDRNTLFTSYDPDYQNRKINHNIIRSYCLRHYSSDERRKLHRVLPAWQIKTSKGTALISPEERNVHIALLERFYSEASSKRQSLDAWLKKHVDGLSFDERIDFLRTMLPENAEQINRRFCHIFTSYVLPEYATKVRLAMKEETLPSHIPESIQFHRVRQFILYEARLQKLQNLNELAHHNTPDSLRLDEIRAFSLASCKTPSQSKGSGQPGQTPEEQQINAAIRHFFDDQGVELKPPSKKANQNDNIALRIRWAFETLKTKTLCPVLLTYMTVICNRRITSEQERLFSTQKAPFYDKRKGRPDQRYMQIILLDDLCKILCIEGPDKFQNWREFFRWQGSAILSRKEELFWRVELQNAYERLPEIGFQLCCLDYIRDCIPDDVERLSFTPCSQLHLGGFQKFWEENHSLIKRQAMETIPKTIELVRKYREFCRSPNEYFEGSRQWLDTVIREEFCPNMSGFKKTPEDENNMAELRRLVLETELQICIHAEARSKLAKQCCDVWNWDRRFFAVEAIEFTD